MKAHIRCRIDQIIKDGGTVSLKISKLGGRVEHSNPAAQYIEFEGTIKVRSIVADQIKIGAVLTLNVEDTQADSE